MNTKQAKKIPIISYLKSLGFLPQKETISKAYFCSPFRNEKEASFKVDLGKNIWYDFGIGKGGNIIDLCMLINNTDVSESLQLLSNLNLSNDFFSFQQQNTISETITIRHIQPVQNKALIQYLESRKINTSIAKHFLQEIYFNIESKRYFALGFKNNKGGFELRNKYFKGASSPKHHTTIKGKASTSINLFEGFFDFLSALVYYRTSMPGNETIVLNSLSHLEGVIPLLGNYKIVNCFMDNDNSGRKAFETVKKNHNTVINLAEKIYPGCKDFNEFICQAKIETAT